MCANADGSCSSSSTCSSPSLYTHRNSISSTSSASSWSLHDDLDQFDSCRIHDDSLSYARKPSGTTNQAIVPLLSPLTLDTYSNSKRPTAFSLPAACFASLSISAKKKPLSTSSSSFTVTTASPPTPKVPFKLKAVQPALPQLTTTTTTTTPKERGRGRRRSVEPRDDDYDDDASRSRRRRRRSSSRSPCRSILSWQWPSVDRRGRATAEELDGWGSSLFAPGYGSGRSGLVARERKRS